MKRIARSLFFFAAILLWVAVAGFALEFYAQYQARQRDRAADRFEEELWEKRAPLDEKVRQQYARGPVKTGSDITARERFLELDEPERRAFVERREEAVFLTGAGGVVQKAYAANPPGLIGQIVRQLAPGKSVGDVLGAGERADFHRALETALQTGQHQAREYPVEIGGEKDVLQFVVQPYPDADKTVLGVFVRESMWKELWVAFRPNVAQNDAYRFETNSLGWRDDPVALPKPPGLFRIVCVGGSTTAEGPANALTYPNLLEALLQRRFGEDRVDVINGGIFAANSHVELKRMDDYLALEPDLLLHYNFVNDVTLFMPKWLAPEGPLATPGLYLKSWLRRSRFFYDYCNRWLLPPDGRLNVLITRDTLSNLRMMHDRATEAGVPMAFASFARPGLDNASPEAWAFYDRQINNMLWGRVINIDSYVHVVDLYNVQLETLCYMRETLYIPVAERIEGETAVFTDICHMTLHGMERKAEAMAETLVPYLEERLAAPTGGP